jgi:hypothetical protein
MAKKWTIQTEIETDDEFTEQEIRDWLNLVVNHGDGLFIKLGKECKLKEVESAS